MTAVAAAAPRSSVATAIAAAAQATGADFGFLLAEARLESGFDPGARAGTSSARGLYQFTAGTWLDTVRRHGHAHGLGWAADAIASGEAGPGTPLRATILALRDQPDAAALMAGELARDNQAHLERRLGRAVGPTDLYLAHFLGARGAADFLSAMARAPDTPAAPLFPAAAAANRGVFHTKDGVPRSLAQVHARFAARLDVPATPLPRVQFAQGLPAEPVPAQVRMAAQVQARLAYQLLAALA